MRHNKLKKKNNRLEHYKVTFFSCYTRDPWWTWIKTLFKGSENDQALFDLTVLVNNFDSKTQLDGSENTLEIK